jgi:hypothetical protein
MNWLGGLDSNQDNQSQSLMYCRLYDLPTICESAEEPDTRETILRKGRLYTGWRSDPTNPENIYQDTCGDRLRQ